MPGRWGYALGRTGSITTDVLVVGLCTSLSGDEVGRVRTWGTHPARQADYTLASPSENCDLPQTLLEPILVGHAAARGSRIRFDTEYLGLEQHPDHVTVTVRDRIGGGSTRSKPVT